MYRIGDFSRLTELSVRVLRHYHEIGLLVPTSVDDRSGYRSYSVEQLAEAHRITALKRLGLSLSQIGTVLRGEPSDEQILGMLLLEKARAEEAIGEAQRRLRDLRREIDSLRDRGSLADLPIVVRSTPAQPFLSFRQLAVDMDAVAALVERVGEVRDRLAPSCAIAAVAHDELFVTEQIDVEVGVITEQTEPVQLDDGVELRAGELEPVAHAATVVTRGFDEQEHRRAMTALAVWLADHRHQLAGAGREVIHAPAGPDPGPVVELQFPVAPAD